MINYIKYTLDGETFSLINNCDGTWSVSGNAPSIIGNYALVFEVSENGIVTYVDSSDSRYGVYLQVVEAIENKVDLIEYLPKTLRGVEEFILICNIEDEELNQLYSRIAKTKNDLLVSTASNDAITNLENFLNIKGQGTLSQRKDYLISLFQKGKKLNEAKIKDIANTITGSDCVVTFYGSNELSNPNSGYGLLKVRVLSPDTTKDYRYEDIERTLKALIPAHIKLVVIKYYALWSDIVSNFNDWQAVKNVASWQAITNYVPPQ